MDVMSAITTSIGIATRLRDVSKNVEDAEFRNLLADLSIALADAKLEVVGLKEQVAKLSDEVRQLNQAAIASKVRPGMKWGCYTFEDDDRLYCTACYDTKGQKIVLGGGTGRVRRCPVCKAEMWAP